MSKKIKRKIAAASIVSLLIIGVIVCASAIIFKRAVFDGTDEKKIRTGIAIKCGDTLLGYAESYADYSSAATRLSESTYAQTGKVYYVNDFFVCDDEKEIPSDAEYISVDELYTKMQEYITDREGFVYALNVNGSTICRCDSALEIYQSLSRIVREEYSFIAGYLSSVNNVTCSISDSYEIIPVEGDFDDVISGDDIYDYIRSVKESDYRWLKDYKIRLCARVSEDIKSSEIRDTVGREYHGEYINSTDVPADEREILPPVYDYRSAENSLIHFKYVCTLSEYEFSPRTTEYIDSDERLEGVVLTLDNGSDGICFNHHIMTFSSGIMTNDELTASERISDCSPVVILRGTRPALERGVSYGKMMWPITFSSDEPNITSYYSEKRPTYDGPGYHLGIDIYMPIGTEIFASDGGVVSVAYASGSYGNLVIIDHNDGTQSAYAHLSKILVYVGQSVAGGDLIGYSGMTGTASGPHLHYEVRVENHTQDPMKFLPALRKQK